MKKCCPICGNQDFTPMVLTERLIGTREKFNYGKCSSCNIVFLVDEIDDFGPYYPEVYHNSDNQTLGFFKDYAMKKLIQFNIFRDSLLGKIIGQIFEKLNGYWPMPSLYRMGDALQILKSKHQISNILDVNILDIGCGGGILLSQLEKQGFKNLTGVEPFSEPQNKYITQTDITSILADSNYYGKYDLVVLSHVLEHLPEHEITLLQLKKLLTKNGVLVIAMPFIGKTFEKYKEYTIFLDAPRHLIIHSLNSFRTLCQKVGLHIEKEFNEQSYREIAASEMYSRDICFSEGRSLGLLELNKKHNIKMAKAINQMQGGGSSVTFYLSNK